MFDTSGPMQVTRFDALLVTVAEWLLLGCAVWAALVGLAVLVEAASHGRMRATTWVGCPRGVRRLLLGGLGVVLAASPAPVLAAEGSPGRPGSPAGRGLPVPARTTNRDDLPARRIEVRAGDCLWNLARSHLPSGASPARVASLADATYRRNRGVIGDDPDLVRPGQRLALPRTDPQPRPEETP